MKNIYPVILTFLLQGCLGPDQDFKTADTFPSHKLPPHVLWQTVQGSASLKGLPNSTILNIARRVQDLFATGSLGQQVLWKEKGTGIQMMIIDISQNSSVSCLKYRQRVQTSEEVRHSEGTACMDALKIWRIVEETPVDPIRRLF